MSTAAEVIAELAAIVGTRPEPRYDADGGFVGMVSGDPDRHRTVGAHRAWSDCGEWCYPSAPCRDCDPPLGRDEVRDILAKVADQPTRRIEALIERSSLGTPAAKAARASVKMVARVRARACQIDRAARSSGEERIQHNGDHLDEIVLTGVDMVHVERMSHHGWWMGVHDGEEWVTLSWQAMGEPTLERSDWPGVQRIDGGLITCCPETWTRVGVDHACDKDAGRPGLRHICECGAWSA